jgi:ubiquinone/menaquinone biosynthesis C-methylase UbiE
MIKRLYYWFLKKTSAPGTKGEPSAGIWQEAVRRTAFRLCSDASGRLLEIGCGEGLFLSRIAALNNELELYGVDPSEEMLGRARKRLKQKGIDTAKLIKQDASELPLPSSLFDMAVCVNVFFNLPSEGKVMSIMEEMARVTKKGGRVVVDIRNSRNPLVRLKYRLARYYDATVENLPLKTYSIDKMGSFMGKCGLKITRTVPIGFPGGGLAPIIVIEAEKE